MQKKSRKIPPILTSETADMILQGEEKVSIDLGLTKTSFSVNANEVSFHSGEKIQLKTLKKILKITDTAFFIDKNKLAKIAIFGNRYYKLLPTKGAPTLEIDGIRMHRTKNTTPEKDAKYKINVLGVDHGFVLDTCTGLGYTAIEAIRNGANEIITIELEPFVIRISAMNPWSQTLFTEPEIHMILSDSYHLLDSMENSRFDFIIHDPPRQRSSGHLYSKNFYEKLYRILIHGGKLFHYTGEPRSRYRRVNIPRGVSRRLRTVGFKKIRYHKQVLGYTCQK